MFKLLHCKDLRVKWMRDEGCGMCVCVCVGGCVGDHQPLRGAIRCARAAANPCTPVGNVAGLLRSRNTADLSISPSRPPCMQPHRTAQRVLLAPTNSTVRMLVSKRGVAIGWFCVLFVSATVTSPTATGSSVSSAAKNIKCRPVLCRQSLMSVGHIRGKSWFANVAGMKSSNVFHK